MEKPYTCVKYFSYRIYSVFKKLKKTSETAIHCLNLSTCILYKTIIRNTMTKKTLIISGILGCTAVIFGAMGAHALKKLITAEQLISFETAVKYQIYHALAILILGIIYKNSPSKYLKYSINLFLAGVIIFSGSIYFLSLKDLLGFKFINYLGPITPLGGILLISGWIFIIIEGLKMKEN